MKKGASRPMKVKRPLRRQQNTLGARIKIMWEEQLVGPPIHYIKIMREEQLEDPPIHYGIQRQE